MSLMLSGVFFSWVMYLGETTVEVDIVLKTSQSRTGGRVIAAVACVGSARGGKASSVQVFSVI